MTWTKLDDRFHGHPKIRRVWHTDRTALGLHILALNYSSCHDLDGQITSEFVEDQLPEAAERTRAIQVLIDCDVWQKNGEGWQIHDFLDYHFSRVEVEAKRKKDARRKRRTRANPKSVDVS